MGLFSLPGRLSPAPFWQAGGPPLPSSQESSVLTSTHILFQNTAGASAFVADRPTPSQPGRCSPFMGHIMGAARALPGADPEKDISSIMWLPHAECTSPPKSQPWHGCVSSSGTGREQGVGRSHEAFFCGLWFPGQLNPVQVLSQVLPDKTRRELFSMLVTKTREGKARAE